MADTGAESAGDAPKLPPVAEPSHVRRPTLSNVSAVTANATVQRSKARQMAQRAVEGVAVDWGAVPSAAPSQATFATAVLCLEHPRRFGISPRLWVKAVNQLSDQVVKAADAPPSWFQLDASVPETEIRLPPVRVSVFRGYSFSVWLRLDAVSTADAHGQVAADAGAGAGAADDGKMPAAEVRRPSRFGFRNPLKSVFKASSTPAAAASADTSASVAQSDAVGGVPPGTISLLRMEAKSDGAGVEVLLVPASFAGIHVPSGDTSSLWYLLVSPGRGTPFPAASTLDPSSLVRLAAGRWHNVCVSHAQPFLKRSKVRCFFDGAFTHTQDVVYPTHKELDNCSMAVGLRGASASASPVPVPVLRLTLPFLASLCVCVCARVCVSFGHTPRCTGAWLRAWLQAALRSLSCTPRRSLTRWQRTCGYAAHTCRRCTTAASCPRRSTPRRSCCART
jgi:hypothetical protein